ncbi:MAG: hypothetical protein CMI30_04620 [Opitutae bacterium]|nr:hypothetical protein [Opitutae bacterium]
MKMRMFFHLSRWLLVTGAIAFIAGCASDDEADQLSPGLEEIPAGDLVNYHPNGEKKLEESYDGYVLHGWQTIWDEMGNIIHQRRYEQGKVVEIRYEDGKKVGD